jgi:hypothetical protein
VESIEPTGNLTISDFGVIPNEMERGGMGFSDEYRRPDGDQSADNKGIVIHYTSDGDRCELPVTWQILPLRPQRHHDAGLRQSIVDHHSVAIGQVSPIRVVVRVDWRA